MAKKTTTVETANKYELVETANPLNLPDLVVEVPKNMNIDKSEWCSKFKKAHSKEYHIIFKIYNE
jgi:hypothetical protein